MEKLQNKSNKLIIGIIGIIVILIAAYLGFTFHFRDKFTFGTTINATKVSNMTIKQAEEELSKSISDYKLTLVGRQDTKVELQGKDFGLVFDSKGKLQEIKDKQNPFKWCIIRSKDKNIKITDIVTFDEDVLVELVNKLDIVSGANIIEPKNATIQYNGDKFEIIDEVYGNKLDKDKVISLVLSAVSSGVNDIELDKEECYINPEFTSKSDKVSETKDTLEKAINTKVIYEFGNESETVDKDEIIDWIGVDNDLNIIFDEAKIKKYLGSLARKYNTIGINRQFLTSSGSIVTVPGGNYGWRMNTIQEAKELTEIIKNGQDVSKEPTYYQKAANHTKNDFGDTHVEIDLTKQYIWFYKDGELITEGDIVTGRVSTNWQTPPGTYALTYKEKNATLKGENYATPVEFWMPFNGNIGLHDATWRTEFGKDLYINGGSHGCVNLPPAVAKAIFENIKPGDPVILY